MSKIIVHRTLHDLMDKPQQEDAISVRFDLGKGLWLEVRVDDDGVAHLSGSSRIRLTPNSANQIDATVDRNY